jgi:hypothetical protein
VPCLASTARKKKYIFLGASSSLRRASATNFSVARSYTALLCSRGHAIVGIKSIYFWNYFVILNLQEYFLIYLLPVI